MANPSGSVLVQLNGNTLTNVTLDANGNGSASFTPGGNGNITVSGNYSGDANFNTSTGQTTEVTQPPTKQNTATNITCTPNPGNPGGPVTIGISVVPA